MYNTGFSLEKNYSYNLFKKKKRTFCADRVGLWVLMQIKFFEANWIANECS